MRVVRARGQWEETKRRAAAMMLCRTGWDGNPPLSRGQTDEGWRAPWGCAAGAPYRGTTSPPPPHGWLWCVCVCVCVCLFVCVCVGWRLGLCVCVCESVRGCWYCAGWMCWLLDCWVCGCMCMCVCAATGCPSLDGGPGASRTMRIHLCPIPVLQKGAYWRPTCSVLFDDPTDEDFDTRNLSCARSSCNCVCVCVFVCVRAGCYAWLKESSSNM